MTPRPLPPSMIRSPSTSIGIQEGHGESSYEERRHASELREQWRDALVEHLSDPTTRSFELVFSDPSPEEIAAVVEEVNADSVARARVIHVLSKLIANEQLHESSELSKRVREIYAGLLIDESRSEPSSTVAPAEEQRTRARGQR